MNVALFGYLIPVLRPTWQHEIGKLIVGSETVADGNPRFLPIHDSLACRGFFAVLEAVQKGVMRTKEYTNLVFSFFGGALLLTDTQIPPLAELNVLKRDEINFEVVSLNLRTIRSYYPKANSAFDSSEISLNCNFTLR